MTKKKKTIIGLIIIVFLALGAGGIFFTSCSSDARNKWSRKKIEFMDGDYIVTFASEGHVKQWTVRSSKVTSVHEKGYYLFWATDGNKKYYVQTPIISTYIEEIK